MTSTVGFDQGTRFGTWTDGTSDLIYRGAMPYILDGLHVGARVLDLGGGNGLSAQYLPPGHDITTLDTDPAKGPDVVADALTYTPTEPFDTVLLRYVLHYLTDRQVRALLEHIATWHEGNVIVIQFYGDPAAKAANSGDAPDKTFRDWPDLQALLTAGPWAAARVNALSYTVHPDFYLHRLGTPGRHPHPESVAGIDLHRSTIEKG